MMYIVKFEIRFFIILIWIDWYFENQTYNKFSRIIARQNTHVTCNMGTELQFLLKKHLVWSHLPISLFQKIIKFLIGGSLLL